MTTILTPGTGSALTADDQVLIDQAIATTDQLTSYHFSLITSGLGITQPLNIEGDYIAPDQTHFSGTEGDQNIEVLIRDGKTYRRDNGGPWLIPASTDTFLRISTEHITFFGRLKPSLQSGTYPFVDAGTEQLNGVPVRHFTHPISRGDVYGNDKEQVVGQLDAWIDPSLPYVAETGFAIDITALVNQPFTQQAVLLITKPNDPTLTIPEAPENATLLPSATPTTTSETVTLLTPPAGTPIVANDSLLIDNALKSTDQLTSYHFTFEGSGAASAPPAQIEGDVIKPDRSHFSGTVNGQQAEVLTIGDQHYVKFGGGWVLQKEPTPTPEGEGVTISASDIAVHPFDQAHIYFTIGQVAVRNRAHPYVYLGAESIDGVETQHYSELIRISDLGHSDITIVEVSLGRLDLWIAKDTGYVKRISWKIYDFVDGRTGEVNFTLSKANDPSISIEDPSTPGAVATPVSTPTVSAESGADANWDGRFGAALDGPVYAIAVKGDDVYVGGSFKHAGGVSATNVARWDGTQWSALGSGTDREVRALAFIGDTLYVAGLFKHAGGESATGIASWDGSNWSTLGTGMSGNYNVGSQGWVFDLAVVGSDLYVLGDFVAAGDVQVQNLAKWDGQKWSALQSADKTRASVSAMTAYDGALYACGGFSTPTSMLSGGIGKWDGTNWTVLTSGYDPSSTTCSGIATNGSDFYIGGAFVVVKNVQAYGIAKWDGTSWSALGGGLYDVQSFVVSGNDIYAGAVAHYGDNATSYLQRWDGSAWDPLGSGVDGSVRALVLSGSNLYVGGEFIEAGGKAASAFTIWHVPANAP